MLDVENWKQKNYLASPHGLRNLNAAVGDTAQWLRTHAALAEDMSLVPNTPIRRLTTWGITQGNQSIPLASLGA